MYLKENMHTDKIRTTQIYKEHHKEVQFLQIS